MSAGGSGPASASLISPWVTRSQWHTIVPYSGSAAIRAASWYGRVPAWPMYGMTGGSGSGRPARRSPASAISPVTYSAMPSDAERPVDRIPATHA